MDKFVIYEANPILFSAVKLNVWSLLVFENLISKIMSARKKLPLKRQKKL